jgi:hypothetical protein
MGMESQGDSRKLERIHNKQVKEVVIISGEM